MRKKNSKGKPQGASLWLLLGIAAAIVAVQGLTKERTPAPSTREVSAGAYAANRKARKEKQEDRAC